jgi:cytochrome oxidase Cu insertion factor (SCO1/SenC/PrrC family)
MGDPPETPRRNLTGAVVPAVAAAALAAVGAILIVGVNGRDRVAAAPQNCILEGAEDVGGPIELVDENGARVTQADFAGEPAVIYFGFTNCPDVCPTSMYAVAEALAEPGGYDLQPILISVDPARDTPQRMREYFHAYGRAQPPAPGATANVYNVDHTSFLYVVDGGWRTVAIIPTTMRERPEDPASPVVAAPVQDIAACIAAGLERGTTGT